MPPIASLIRCSPPSSNGYILATRRPPPARTHSSSCYASMEHRCPRCSEPRRPRAPTTHSNFHNPKPSPPLLLTEKNPRRSRSQRAMSGDTARPNLRCMLQLQTRYGRALDKDCMGSRRYRCVCRRYVLAVGGALSPASSCATKCNCILTTLELPNTPRHATPLTSDIFCCLSNIVDGARLLLVIRPCFFARALC